MSEKPTQEQMFRTAQKRGFEINEAFQEMLQSDNPITKKELRKLIQKRPELWARFESYLDTDVLPEE